MRAHRWKRACAGLAAALALGACDLLRPPSTDPDAAGAASTGVRTRPDTRVDDVAVGEPGAARRQWRAASGAAREITGNLTASLPEGRSGPLVLAFASGITMRLDMLGVRQGGDAIGQGQASFARLLEAEPNIGVFMYRVASENVDATAPKGGLCAGAKTAFVAIAEFIGPDGDWVFRAISFKGAAPPDPAGPDPQMCAAFAYALG